MSGHRFAAMGLLAVLHLAPPLDRPHTLGAQHVEAPGIVDPSFERCALCHRPHLTIMAPYLLRVDPGAAGTFPASGLDRVSESCLRCHWTAALRSAQPEFLAPPPSTSTGYLGNDFSDDHPLGRPADGMARAGFLGDRLAAGPGGRIPALSMSGMSTGLAPGGMIQCSTCHEPHAPGRAIVPDALEQLALCEVCHISTAPEADVHSSLACTDCHLLHGGSASALLRDPDPNAVCLACHSSAPTFTLAPSSRRSGARSMLGVSSASQAHPTGRPAGACPDCHPPHGR